MNRRVGVLLAGYLAVFAVPAVAETAATVLWFSKQEPGVEPYRVRYIVTPAFLRSDDGQDKGDFLLFDRGKRRIYSVAHDDRRILVIDGDADAPHKPDDLRIDIRRRNADKAPTIAGRPTQQVDLVAADDVCRSALVAPGFLESARAALQEFHQALAVQQSRTLANTPAAYQTPCFLSRYIYASDFDVAQGMALADWDNKGERRELTDYKIDVPVAGALFELPDGYARFKAGQRATPP